MNGPIPAAWQSMLHGALRIVASYLFILHGSMKIFGFPPTEWSPAMGSLPWIGGVIEVVGGLMVLLGLFTRPVAFLLAGQMAVAYFTAHASQNALFPMLNGGEPAVLFCFIFLFFAAAGPGAFAIRRD